MRRIVTWALTTVTVLVLVFGYHTSRSSQFSSAQVSTPVPDATSSGSSDDDSNSSADSSTSAASRTYTGDAVQTEWGPVQVAITVADGAITDVQVPQYPTGNHRDEEINSYALPILVQETLDAQGDDIQMVSGATVTSEGYLQSLQSALDQAGL